jgi:hypothetical protein
MGINEERTTILRRALDYHKHKTMDTRAQETRILDKKVPLHDIKFTIW